MAPSCAEDVSGLYRRRSEGGPHCTAIRFHGRGADKEQGKEVAGKEQGKEVEVAQEASEVPPRRNTAAGGSLAWDTFRRLRCHASQVREPGGLAVEGGGLASWHPGILAS